MNILAIGARPDDIEFGCGGALSAYAQAGQQVFPPVLLKDATPREATPLIARALFILSIVAVLGSVGRRGG